MLTLYDEFFKSLPTWYHPNTRLDRLFPWTLESEADPVSITVDNDDKHTYVRAVVPGFTEDQLMVNVDDRCITISGKREEAEDTKNRFSSSQISFEKVIPLSQTMNIEAVDAKLKNGILVVTIPKNKVPEKVTRSIPIQSLEAPKLE